MITHSPEETKECALLIAREIKKSGAPKKPLVIALTGELGSGKTTFTQSLLKGLGVREHVTSPTFVLMKKYKIKKPHECIVHIDAYRLRSADDARELEIEKIMSEKKNIVVIEWPERIKKIIPKHAVWISFSHGKKEDERKITIKS